MNRSYPVSQGKVLPVLFGFFIMGFCDLVGISVTYAKDMFGWSETKAGFLPSMVFFWFLVLSVPTAILANRIGRKNTVMISMLFTFIGMLIPFFIFNEITCYLAFGLLGIGNTILQVSLNPLLTNVVKKEKLTSSLTAGQFIKAISSFLGPLVAGFCSSHLGSWEKMFPIYAIVTLISSMWLYFTQIKETGNEERSLSSGRIVRLLGNRKILLLFLGILCIVGLDVGMNTVTPKLLIERVGLAKRRGRIWYKLVLCGTNIRHIHRGASSGKNIGKIVFQSEYGDRAICIMRIVYCFHANVDPDNGMYHRFRSFQHFCCHLRNSVADLSAEGK